jgi:hypothetical protein
MMSNSSLVNYRLISPHQYGKRNHKIDTVSIHCVVGQCSVETLGYIFQTKEASSNYGIGYDGRIGQYVDENSASWCTSDYANDNRAITIEVASDTSEPFAVNAAAYKSLIKLLVDICRRNGIKKLVWSRNKSDRVNHKNGCNMTVHRDYCSYKSCPGTYLYDRHGQIADEVNKKLNEKVKVKLKDNGVIYKYAFKDPIGGASKPLIALKADDKVTWIKDDGFGWSKVRKGTKTGWIMNSHLKKTGLSTFKTYKLATNTPAIRISGGKRTGTVLLKAGTAYRMICTIEGGLYQRKRYISVDDKRYYI